MNIRKFIGNNWILILILFVGLFLRIYKVQQLFMYSHDSDLAGWFIRDVVVNNHLRLIGQETSTHGIFIGPLFYYLLIPFYLLFNMDSIGGTVLITILGMFSLWSIYFVFSRIFEKNVGIIGSLVYAISYYTVFNDREIVPTMPVIVWSTWFLYGIHLLLKDKHKAGYFVFGILLGLIWNLNMALVILIPLIALAQFLSKKKFSFKNSHKGIYALVLFSIPLVVFELRHGFSQTISFINSLTTDQHDVARGMDKFLRVIHLNSKNIAGVVWGDTTRIKYEYLFIFLLVVLAFLIIRKYLDKKLSIVLVTWMALYFTFFSVYSKVLSEYYLNGMIVIWVLIISLGIYALLKNKHLKYLGILLLIAFAYINFQRFFEHKINRSGYLERKNLVNEIRLNSLENNYPCVSVSYITDPGYNLGYRYFFFLEGMHVNSPISKSPVYTIVFPLRDDVSVDKTFGAIGLIYPDFSKYNEADVQKSCSGENSNLTDPMFGFTN